MEQKNETQIKLKRTEKMIQLGELCYRAYRSKDNGPIAPVELYQEIEALDMELIQATGANIDHEGSCPQCNSPIADGTMFCANCGFSMKDYNSQFVGNCQRCGSKIKQNQKFCQVCGIRL